MTKKYFLEFPLHPFLESLKMKRTELSLSSNSLKPNSDKLVHNRQERVSLSLGLLKHSDGFARRENYRTSICYPPSLTKIKRYGSAMTGEKLGRELEETLLVASRS